MGKVTLYSTHCPKCNVLEKKLDAANVNYEIVTDVEVMSEKGFKSAPILEVDGDIKTFSEAIEWVSDIMEGD